MQSHPKPCLQLFPIEASKLIMLPLALAIPALQLLLIILFILSVAQLLNPKEHKNGRKYPPGPKPLPIIGNLHLLGKLPHRSIHELAKKYGPIMSLKLGQVPTIVVSSPETAELILKTHDSVFASRPLTQASKYICYDSKGLIFSEYGSYWRNVTKLCTFELLSVNKVQSFAPLRSEEVRVFVKSLEKSAASREVVNVSKRVGELVENVVQKMIWGPSNIENFDVKRLVHDVLHLMGVFDVGDYIPWVGAFDLQGLVRKFKKAHEEFDQMLEQIIKDHEAPSRLSDQKNGQSIDFTDTLLSHMKQSKDKHIINKTNLKAILLDIIIGSLDTTIMTTDWAMSELLRHPKAMTKLQDELKNVVGMGRVVEEDDIPKLPYLNMVVKETFRIHPPAPLLVPRECLEDITINGYFIAKKSRVLVNSWTIGRDPKIWSDNAEDFYPDRFQNTDIDSHGLHFQFLPFGSGRRRCPGMQLGLTTVPLVLAQLVHCFNWELPLGMSANDLDMTEEFGLTTPRVQNLLAIPTYRLVNEGN
ncbi:cytochrome P450 CYP736A12-like [Lotus japonicus]|uniref:cytochrome P450 CYP736A12-like n=1 Tax=Lotus japonicus TaxID=34305 RepID=UPI002585FE7B|nr:cytochrome P450 CYP736A12-like [Lotus japonicus]